MGANGTDTGPAENRSDLFAELRQRKVFRTVATYAVVAWVVVQIAEATFQPLHIPDWIGTLVVICALLGFPVTLVLAWVFEVTADGVQRDGPSRRSRMIYAVAVIWGVLAIGYFVVFRYIDFAGPQFVENLPGFSLGVLPLVNRGADDLEYFSDGITEELIGTLSRLDGLRVIGRASAFHFKGSNAGAQEIARELGVTHVLEGSVRRESDRFRISLQLTAASDGFQVWSQFFDGRMEDVLSVQQRIAAVVADSLAAQLTPDEPVGSDPVGIDTYDLYLLGQRYFNRRGADDLQKAVSLYRQATELSPGFAEAHSGMADATLLMGRLGLIPLDAAVDVADASSQAAIDLAPASAEAYASRGLLELTRGDTEAARNALATSVELNSNYATALLWLGMTLESQGNIVAAAGAYRRAAALEPLHPEINRRLARLDFAAGKRDVAVERLERALRFNQNVALLYETRALGALTFGQPAIALDWLARGDELAGPGPMSTYLRVRAYLMALQPEAAASALAVDVGVVQDSRLAFLAQATFHLANDAPGVLKQFAIEVADSVVEEDLKVTAAIWDGIADCRIGDAQDGARKISEVLAESDSGTFGPSDRAFYAGTLVACLISSNRQVEAGQLGANLIESLIASRSLGWASPDSQYAVAAAYAAAREYDSARSWLKAALEAGWLPEVPYSRDPRWAAWFERSDACDVPPLRSDPACEFQHG